MILSVQVRQSVLGNPLSFAHSDDQTILLKYGDDQFSDSIYPGEEETYPYIARKDFLTLKVELKREPGSKPVVFVRSGDSLLGNGTVIAGGWKNINLRAALKTTSITVDHPDGSITLSIEGKNILVDMLGTKHSVELECQEPEETIGAYNLKLRYISRSRPKSQNDYQFEILKGKESIIWVQVLEGSEIFQGVIVGLDLS